MDALRPDLRVAGAALMRHWRTDLRVEEKADGSPVTVADRAAHDLLAEALHRLAPGVPLISEEGEVPAATPGPLYWLLDPLDGTKSFLRGERDFAVCLALIAEGRPVAGAMFAPAHEALAWGAVGKGAFLDSAEGPRPAPLREVTRARMEAGGVDLMVPSRHPTPRIDAHLQGFVLRRTPTPSAVKFLRILEGKADAYIRFERVQQWDIAAGEALLIAGGGECLQPSGAPTDYGWHPQLHWQSSPFVATARGGFAALQPITGEVADA